MNTLLTNAIQMSPSSSSPNAPLPLPNSKRRILLADDSPQIRESLSKLLRNAGYHVTTAAHGGHVLDRVLEGDFDLLLLDLNMPGMDGWEAMEHLAHLRPSLPVIIITAQPHQREWAHAEGARWVMEKPLDLPLLLQRIREFIETPTSSHRDPKSGFWFSAEEKSEFRFSDRYRGWGTD